MRRRAGVLGLVIAVLAVLWWWHGSRETKVPEAASKAAITAVSRDRHGQAKNATLSGRVTRAKDGTSIAVAYVAISVAGDSVADTPGRSTADSRKHGVPLLVPTTADGRWTTPIAAGTYNLGVVADGFLPARQGPILVVAHAAVEANVTLNEGGVVIRGVVSDIGGGPIGGARVSAATGEAYIATFTRPDGSYRVSLDPGFVQVDYSHDDYLATSTMLSLSSVEAVHDVTLVPAGTVRGVVIARDTGKPVANAVITSPDAGVFLGDTATDTDGRFVLHHVRAGDTSLFANAPGYVTTRATVVNLGIGESVEAKLIADRGYTLRGHITREGRPTEGVAGVTVDAHTDAAVPDSRSRVATERDGAFEIVGLAPARYTLTATGHDILGARRGDVVVARDVDDLRIEVAGGVTLRGQVSPPERVELRVYKIDSQEIGTAARVTEDATGAFTATNVPPGRIELDATSATKNGQLSVKVGTADQSGLVITLRSEPTHVVSGTVVDSSNKPIPRAFVRSSGDATTSDDAGAFELHVNGPTDLFANFGVDDMRQHREPLAHLVVDRDIHGVVVKIPEVSADIRGHVVGSDGKPASDVWVSANTPPVLTGADGSFVISPLRSGTNYDVRADSARRDATAIAHGVATGSSIEIVLQATATLHGRVTFGGAPVRAYELRCQGVEYYERRVEAADGSFTIEHVHAYEQRPLECRAATEQAEGHATVVFAGASAQVAIELVPFAAVTGTVLDVFAKQPVRDARIGLMGGELGSLFATEPSVAANGRFELDHVASGDVRVLVRTPRTYAQVLAHATPGQTIDVGTIFMPPTPVDPADLGIYVGESLEILPLQTPRYPELHRGDTIVAVDNVSTSVMPSERWVGLFLGGAERGHTYALTLARGVTVNVTAE